jgi:hypothetical protein
MSEAEDPNDRDGARLDLLFLESAMDSAERVHVHFNADLANEEVVLVLDGRVPDPDAPGNWKTEWEAAIQLPRKQVQRLHSFLGFALGEFGA